MNSLCTCRFSSYTNGRKSILCGCGATVAAWTGFTLMRIRPASLNAVIAIITFVRSALVKIRDFISIKWAGAIILSS
jgi:hypothetical protein